ncbi:hypothetical protein ACFVQ3_17740 [Oerskovia sp. NPDC057915]|uniref:hypothetical protein n=1 Tax=Oerskovia sp. NPDC057915 TaxID=3346280 RepID=UPI0036D8EF9C
MNAPIAVTAAEYLDTTRRRMTDDGCEVGWDQVGPVQALVGYRKKFVVPAMSRVHVVTAVAHFTPTELDVDRYTRDVSAFAKQRSNSLRGVQSGVGAFAVIVADSVTPEVAVAARVKPRLEFAVIVQPVVVDLAAREIHTFRGRRFIGAALNGFLRRTLNAQIQVPA